MNGIRKKYKLNMTFKSQAYENEWFKSKRQTCAHQASAYTETF